MGKKLEHVMNDAQPVIVFAACMALAFTHSFQIAGGTFAGLEVAAPATWAVNRIVVRGARQHTA